MKASVVLAVDAIVLAALALTKDVAVVGYATTIASLVSAALCCFAAYPRAYHSPHPDPGLAFDFARRTEPDLLEQVFIDYHVVIEKDRAANARKEMFVQGSFALLLLALAFLSLDLVLASL